MTGSPPACCRKRCIHSLGLVFTPNCIPDMHTRNCIIPDPRSTDPGQDLTLGPSKLVPNLCFLHPHVSGAQGGVLCSNVEPLATVYLSALSFHSGLKDAIYPIRPSERAGVCESAKTCSNGLQPSTKPPSRSTGLQRLEGAQQHLEPRRRLLYAVPQPTYFPGAAAGYPYPAPSALLTQQNPSPYSIPRNPHIRTSLPAGGQLRSN